MKLRILSYNTHKLINVSRTKYFLSELKKNLSQLDLDFVFLQEIRGEHPNKHQDSFSDDPLEHLADELWDYFIYGKNAIYSSGNHGNAILSKYSFKNWENWDISNHRFEKRSLLLGDSFLDGSQNISLGCTHLDLTQIGRSLQLSKIETHLTQSIPNDQPVIFCGDMNDWNGKSSQHFEALGYFAPASLATFPSFFPLLRLDRIFYKNIHLSHLEVLNGKEWQRLSDHLPIYAEFDL